MNTTIRRLAAPFSLPARPWQRWRWASLLLLSLLSASPFTLQAGENGFVFRMTPAPMIPGNKPPPVKGYRDIEVDCPAPDYPWAAYRYKERGTVTVKVHFRAGQPPEAPPDRVELERGSGSRLLDDAVLVQAKARWRSLVRREVSRSVSIAFSL